MLSYEFATGASHSQAFRVNVEESLDVPAIRLVSRHHGRLVRI
jgi:hypothetical protein